MDLQNTAPAVVLMILLSAVTSPINAAAETLPANGPFGSAERLQKIVDAAAAETISAFARNDLQTNQLAITLIDLRDLHRPIEASYRGEVRMYPASVVKLFYLVAAHRWMEHGELRDSAELRRAMRDMIVDSSNDATHYVVDAVTGTTEGPELPDSEMKEWSYKRNAINRYFFSVGYTNINVNQKPWGDGPYGRERIFVGKAYDNRNALTTAITARLLTEIIQGRAISSLRSAEMMKLLQRDPFKKKTPDCEPDQNYDFTGAAPLPPGAKVWSKAGWTSTVRHDAAYVELPNGQRFVLVTFTTGHGNERDIIPTVAKKIIDGLL